MTVYSVFKLKVVEGTFDNDTLKNTSNSAEIEFLSVLQSTEQPYPGVTSVSVHFMIISCDKSSLTASRSFNVEL